MGRNQLWAAATTALLATFASGCGALLQAGYGFNERETRRATRTRKVRFEGLPPGATVTRIEGGRAVPVADPRFDLAAYEVEETVEVPRSRWPMYLGTGLDAAFLTGSAVLFARADDDQRVWATYGLYFFGAGAIADLAFSIIYSIDQEPELVEHTPVGTSGATYVARLGAETRRADLELAWADRATFDFTTPTDAAGPGGPRLGALAPPPPPVAPAPEVPTEVITPAPEPEERWYGWQILGLDALSITGFVLGVTGGDRRLAYASAGVYATAPPLVHFLNGQFARGGGSFAGRTLGPLVGGSVGLLLGIFAIPFVDCSGDLCGLYAPAYGGLIGAGAVALATPILDAAFLAWKPVEEDDAEAASVRVVPSTGVTDVGDPTFGLAGRF